MLELRYPLFDGKKLWKGAAVTIDNGLITSVKECEPALCDQGLLMPGLIDAHVHMENRKQVEDMIHNGITTVCDVSASRELVESSKQLSIISSAGMAMGMVLNPHSYVEQAVANGAKYIKVLLFNALSIGKPALRGIVKAAHEKGLKVAVHATALATVQQAVEAEADILLHVPMKQAITKELVLQIREKGIAVAPTLVMMETFAQSGRNGYKVADYSNAEEAVKMLHEYGVTIIAGTDANPGAFAPGVDYGTTLHREMKLLVKAGLTPVEALAAATGYNAETFGLKAGRIIPGYPATMLLVEGSPHNNIADSINIQSVWIKGDNIR